VLPMSHMKGNAIKVRIDDELATILDDVCQRSGRTRSEVIRMALKRHLALVEFRRLRRQMMPFAAAHGFLTDEDVFDSVS
jgi:metal-responsive CopG/Arc/MetJ family transcriptional regulator